ncbi:hypothetical protein D3C76_1365120 [compost metagenome]
MDKAQPRHGADAIEHVPVKAAPLAMFILEQVARVFQRRYLDGRVPGNPFKFPGIQRDPDTGARLCRFTSRIRRGDCPLGQDEQDTEQ